MVQVYFLAHSGFAVKTKNHFLIFDYYKTRSKFMRKGLPSGILPIKELKKQKNITVFVSHSHYDHYNPAIFKWEEELNNVQYVLSDDVPVHQNALMVTKNETYHLDDMTIQTFRSTDKGVAFLVQVDGLNIFHAGDLNNWAWAKQDHTWLLYMKVTYEKQIKKVAQYPIDLAFVPVDSKLKQNMLLGIEFFMQQVSVKYVIPMHTRLGNTKAIQSIKASPYLSKYYNKQILPPMKRGEILDLPLD